jgi:hypothetical protein
MHIDKITSYLSRFVTSLHYACKYFMRIIISKSILQHNYWLNRLFTNTISLFRHQSVIVSHRNNFLSEVLWISTFHLYIVGSFIVLNNNFRIMSKSKTLTIFLKIYQNISCVKKCSRPGPIDRDQKPYSLFFEFLLKYLSPHISSPSSSWDHHFL